MLTVSIVNLKAIFTFLNVSGNLLCNYQFMSAIEKVLPKASAEMIAGPKAS